jgi:AcrR family transcriptional regulator
MPVSDALAAAPTRREQRKQEFRDRIMDAAIELFRESGIAAVTLEEICELARVSRPTFYSYYASKQELVQALGEKLWLRVAADLTSESLAKSATTAQYLKSFFKVVSRQLGEYSNLERELIREIMVGDVKSGSSLAVMKGLIEMFIAVYTEGQRRGDVGNLYPVDFLAEMTMGGINTVMMRWAVEDNYPLERRLRQLADYIPRMLELKR